jgi:hypothetical protein
MGAKAETKIVATRLPVELWREIQHRALDEGRPVQALVTDALELYLRSRGVKRSGKRKEK